MLNDIDRGRLIQAAWTAVVITENSPPDDSAAIIAQKEFLRQIHNAFGYKAFDEKEVEILYLIRFARAIYFAGTGHQIGK